MKQRIIIFDSPDGTGKTNISQALSKELGIPYFRMDSQHDNWRKNAFKTALEFDQTYIASFLRQTRGSVIFDRAYPSEWVYSRVYNRETNPSVLRRVDDEFANMGTIIVVPLRHDYTKSREDEVVDRSMLSKLHDGYLDFCRWTKCTTVQIYVDDLFEKLESEIKMIREVTG